MGSQKFTNIHPNTTKSLFPNNIKNKHVKYQLVRKTKKKITKTRKISSSTNTLSKCEMGPKETYNATDTTTKRLPPTKQRRFRLPNTLPTPKPSSSGW